MFANHKTLLKAIIFISFLLCSMTSWAVSSNEKTLLLHPSYHQVDSILIALDDIITHKTDFQAKRMAQADSLLRAACHKTGQDRIEALKASYNIFSHISGKKSMETLDRMESLPEHATDRDLRLWVLDSRGYIYAVMGMFHRSYALLHNIDINSYDRPARLYHYDTMHRILYWANTAFCQDTSLLPEEKVKMKAYNDTLKNENNSAINLAFNDIEDNYQEHDYDAALKKLIDLYPKTSGQYETYVYAKLSEVFTAKKDTLATIFYLAKSSINDIKDGTTEYMCLPVLVQFLFKQGDIERAYHYLKCCIDDAYLYPSQFLISQTANIFPIIDKEYQQTEKDYRESQRKMMIMAFCGTIMFFILIALSAFLHNRNLLTKELKQANDRLAETNNDLEKANNIKDIFLQNMRHELHTPLNAINGFAQLLDESDGQIDDASRKEMISAIRSSSHQLNILLDNIIMLTEYENTRIKTTKDKIRISSIFESLREVVYNPKADNVAIIYRNNIPDSTQMVSSEAHIVTILNNLIDNSLKFTETGSVTTTADIEGNKVVFRVHDTGVGIPEDKKATVFDRFSKLNEFAQGVGLGLPLCHTLTTLLGGNISIEKSDSTGTIIRVILPLV